MSLAAAVEAFENSAKLESSLVWVAATKSWKIGQTAGPTNNRAATARALVTAIRAATPYEIASLLPSLDEALRPPLLDGRPTSASCFAACAEATSALAAKLSLPAVPPRVYSLLFLLIDQAGCAGGAASEIGASAHAARRRDLAVRYLTRRRTAGARKRSRPSERAIRRTSAARRAACARAPHLRRRDRVAPRPSREGPCLVPLPPPPRRPRDNPPLSTPRPTSTYGVLSPRRF